MLPVFALPAHELMQTRASLGKVCIERENLLVQGGRSGSVGYRLLMSCLTILVTSQT